MNVQDARKEIALHFGGLVEEEETNPRNPHNCLWVPAKYSKNNALVKFPHEILAKNLNVAGEAIVKKPQNARGILMALETSLRQTEVSFPYFGVINKVVGEKIAEKKIEMQNKPRDFGKHLQNYARTLSKDMRLINRNPYYCCAMIILAMTPDGGIRYGLDFDKLVRRNYSVDMRGMAKSNKDAYLCEVFKDVLDLGGAVYKSTLRLIKNSYEIAILETGDKYLEPKERFTFQEKNENANGTFKNFSVK